MNKKTTNQLTSLASRIGKFAIRNSLQIGFTDIDFYEYDWKIQVYLLDRTENQWMISIKHKNHLNFKMELSGYSNLIQYEWNMTQEVFNDMVVQVTKIVEKIEMEEDGQEEIEFQYNCIKSQIQDLQNELSEIAKKMNS